MKRLWKSLSKWSRNLDRLAPRRQNGEVLKFPTQSRVRVDRHADLEARIVSARDDLERLDGKLSAIAADLANALGDPESKPAQRRWKDLAAELGILALTANQLVE